MISRALARLSDKQRRAVQPRHLDRYPRARVAALMGCTVMAVRTLERQAVAHLKADLGVADLGDATLAAVSAGQA